MQVRQLILTASAFVIAGARPAHAQGSALVPGDSGLQSLVAEALARNPTVAQRQEAVRAATLRIRPAGSLPDPMLTVGVMDLVDRKSTRLNSSHANISYAVFCLKKKKSTGFKRLTSCSNRDAAFRYM